MLTTGAPPNIDEATEKVSRTHPVREVTTLKPSMASNASIPTLNSLLTMREQVWSQMLRMKGVGVKRIHLMMCASNAVCCYVGTAIEQFGPEVVVYDFTRHGEVVSVEPRIVITPTTKGPSIQVLEE